MAGTYDVTGASIFSAGNDTFTGPIESIGSTLTASSGTVNLETPFSGNPLTIGTLTVSGGTVNYGTNPLTVTTLTMTGGTLNDASAITVGGLLTLGGTLSGLATAGASSGTGTMAANGGIITAGFALDGETLTNAVGQTATFSGSDSIIYEQDGADFVNDGTFLAQALGDFTNEGNRGNPVSFTNNGTFTYSVNNSSEFANVAFNVNAPGTVDVQTGTLVLAGGGTSTGGGFTVESGATLEFGGSAPFKLDSATTLSGTGSLTELASSTVKILGSSPSFTGPTDLEAGTMLVDGSQPASTVTITSGTFGGSGTVGPITTSPIATGSEFSPGDGQGILTAQGNVTLNTNYDFSINGANPGTGFTQLVVNGTATLTGSSLNTSINGFTPTPGETFPIIISTAPIVGTFNFLPEGATFSIDGIPFRISYAGGGGDDIVLTQAASKTTTASTLSSSAPSGSSFGQAVTFTATVATGSGTGTPTGTVTFTIDGAAQTPVPLQVVGGVDQASLPAISTLTGGSHTIEATFSGDDTFSSSTAQPLTQAVNPIASTITLSSSAPNGSSFGQAVTFTATVASSSGTRVPTGTVTFTIDGTAQTPVPLQMLGNIDHASLTPISSLTIGQHTIGAIYSGDDNFATSTAQPLTQTVNPIASTTTLSSSAPSGSSFGQAVTFTATVASGTGSGTSTGTVTFTIDGTAQTPVPLQVVGGVDQASLPAISTLSVGSHIIGATYSGDDNFSTSTAPSLTQNVASMMQASTTTFASSVNPSTAGQEVTFTATVTPEPVDRHTDGYRYLRGGTSVLGTTPLDRRRGHVLHSRPWLWARTPSPPSTAAMRISPRPAASAP